MSKLKVLIPLDSSAFSRQVLPQVRRLCAPETHDLVLLRVAQYSGVMSDPVWLATAGSGVPVYASDAFLLASPRPAEAHMEDDLFATLREELEQDSKALRNEGYQVTVAVQRGDPATEIVAFAEKEQVDLIAMATHARSGLSRLLGGSVTETVLHHSSVPLLILNPLPQPEEVRLLSGALAARDSTKQRLRLALAVDNSPGCHPAAGVAGELARELDAPLTALVAVRELDEIERSREAMAQVSACIGQGVATLCCKPLVGLSDEVLLQHLREHRYDLVVTGPFRHAGQTDPRTLGPATHRIVQYAPTSVFVVKGMHPGFRTILAAVNTGDEPVVEAAAAFARAVDARLTLLHVIPHGAAPDLPDDEGPVAPEPVLEQRTPVANFLQQSIATLRAAGYGRDAVRLCRGAVAETILREAHRAGCDLVIVGDQSGPGRFLGGVSDWVLRNATRSVLVIRTV